jgi:ABC-type transporter Mla subunit MlaD
MHSSRKTELQKRARSYLVENLAEITRALNETAPNFTELSISLEILTETYKEK